jgi:hypothetical protein
MSPNFQINLYIYSFNPILVKLQPVGLSIDSLTALLFQSYISQITTQEVEDSLSSISIPHGEASGLCKYCRHQTRCYNDGNGLIERPRSIPKMKPSSHNMLSNPCSTRKTYS